MTPQEQLIHEASLARRKLEETGARCPSCGKPLAQTAYIQAGGDDQTSRGFLCDACQASSPFAPTWEEALARWLHVQRKAFRAVIEIVTDFEEPSMTDINARLKRADLGYDAKVLVRSVETIDIPTDAPPFKDRDVKCYSCDRPKPRSTSKPWCPSPECGTYYTCKDCQDSCPMTTGANDCKVKTCMIHSYEARTAFRARTTAAP